MFCTGYCTLMCWTLSFGLLLISLRFPRTVGPPRAPLAAHDAPLPAPSLELDQGKKGLPHRPAAPAHQG